MFWDDLLDELLASDAPTAREISANSFRWDGELLSVEGSDPVYMQGHGYGIGRQALLDLLLERALDLGVRVRFECDVQHRSELPDADLIVACDGVNSRVRQLHDVGRPCGSSESGRRPGSRRSTGASAAR